MKVSFLLGSRGEWGYIRPIIAELSRRGHDPSIYAVNMAVLGAYGQLATEIAAEGYPVTNRLLTAISGDSHAAMAKSVALTTSVVADVLMNDRPDWFVLAGDRAEQLGAAVAASYTYTPTAHVQAGERSGNIDDTARHAIARLVHVHFASNLDAAERLIRSGESESRVFISGAPQLDDLLNDPLPTRDDLGARRLVPREEYLLACLHPVTENLADLEKSTGVMIDVLEERSEPKVWILPNNDPGGELIRQLVLGRRRSSDFVHTNLVRTDYLGVMKHAKALVGNSSSGILEAPSLGLCVVNVGERQRDRVRGRNVIDVDFEPAEIANALERASSVAFVRSLEGMENPYGDGLSSSRIVSTLEEIRVDQALLAKRLAF